MCAQVWRDDDEARKEVEEATAREVIEKIEQISDEILKHIEKKDTLVTFSVDTDLQEAENLLNGALFLAELKYGIPIVCDDINLEPVSMFYINKGNCYALYENGERKRVLGLEIFVVTDDVTGLSEVTEVIPIVEPEPEDREAVIGELRNSLVFTQMMNAMLFKPELTKALLESFTNDPDGKSTIVVSTIPNPAWVATMIALQYATNKLGYNPETLTSMKPKELIDFLYKNVPVPKVIPNMGVPRLLFIKLPRELVEGALGEKNVKYALATAEIGQPVIVPITKDQFDGLVKTFMKVIKKLGETVGSKLGRNGSFARMAKDLGLI